MRVDDKSPELWVFASMEWAHQHGVWEIINTLVLLVSALVGFSLLFWAKRRVRNLNFYVRRLRDASNYPLKVYIEIRNYTGRSVVISSPYFVFGDLRPDPNARGDSPSREYEVKFPDRGNQTLSEVEYLLRHREEVSTWVPVDPTQTDQEVDRAIEHRAVGRLRCMCTWLQEKPKVHALRRKI